MPEIIYRAPGVRIINLTAGAPRFIPKDELWPMMPAFCQSFLRFIMKDGVRYDLLHGNFWMSGWVAVQIAHLLRAPTTETFHALGTTKRKFQGVVDSSPAERISVKRLIVQHMTRLVAWQCPNEQSELENDYAADPGKSR